ncbi:MAG: hypothetical protein WCS43_15485 [Verrucomicrobiota bacterium]
MEGWIKLPITFRSASYKNIFQPADSAFSNKTSHARKDQHRQQHPRPASTHGDDPPRAQDQQSRNEKACINILVHGCR